MATRLNNIRLQRRRFILTAPALAAIPYIANAKQSLDPRAVASMLMLGFIGTSSESASALSIADDLNQQRIGGVCFLGHNTKSKRGIEQLTHFVS